MELAKLILEYIRVLIWPFTILIVVYVFRNQVNNLINRIRKADFPGGISIETFPNELKEAKELSAKVEEEIKPSMEAQSHAVIPLTEANDRMLKLGLAPSASGLEFSKYRVLAEQDPNLALAGIRIEIETMLKNVAKGFNVVIDERDGAGIVAKKLNEKGAITNRQFELIKSIINLCNTAVHGERITKKQAEDVLDIAAVLIDQYILWLSWGFTKK